MDFPISFKILTTLFCCHIPYSYSYHIYFIINMFQIRNRFVEVKQFIIHINFFSINFLAIFVKPSCRLSKFERYKSTCINPCLKILPVKFLYLSPI